MKYHPDGSVLFCTCTLEEGLLLLANPLCQAIVKSCLAAACELYPVRICHMIVEATHIHLVLVVIKSDHVDAFFQHFKTESAHMINGLLGRNKRTLWCEGCEGPIVLNPTRALLAMAYLYANSDKDNLETCIDRHPGFSSWKMFQSGKLTRQWKRLRRPQFAAITRDANNLRGYIKLAEEVVAASDEVQTFTLEPNAWMEAFGHHSPEEQRGLNERRVKHIRLLEDRAERKRVQERKRGFLTYYAFASPLFSNYPSRCHHQTSRRNRCSDKSRPRYTPLIGRAPTHRGLSVSGAVNKRRDPQAYHPPQLKHTDPRLDPRRV